MRFVDNSNSNSNKNGGDGLCVWLSFSQVNCVYKQGLYFVGRLSEEFWFIFFSFNNFGERERTYIEISPKAQVTTRISPKKIKKENLAE